MLTGANMFGIEHHSVFNPCFAIEQFLKVFAPLIAVNLDQKSYPAQIDSQNGHTTWSAEMSCPQYTPVTADCNQYIKFTVSYAFTEALIVERTTRCIQPFVFEISSNSFCFLESIG